MVPKTVGNAVLRNVVRRQLRHAVRERLPGLPPQVDIVVRALPGSASRSYAQLCVELDDAMRAAARRRAPHRRSGAGTEGHR